MKFVTEPLREICLTTTKPGWIGLTDAELYEITPFTKLAWARKIAQAIEAKLKDKNTRGKTK